MIIVDECHRVSGSSGSMKMFYRVMSRLAARYKFGLSATVHRSDGLIRSTFAVLGDVKYKVSDEAVAEKIMPVEIRKRETGIRINRVCLDTDGTLVYSRLIPYLTEHADRCRMIVKDLEKNREHSNLIHSDRLEHLRMLRDILPEELQDAGVMID